MRPVADVYLGEDPRLVGRVRFSMRRGQISTTFAYDDSYLAWNGAFAIDPGLPLAQGSGFVPGLPGAFGDAAPDRWGRRLIRRGATHALDEVDYLLGVDDHLRNHGFVRRENRWELSPLFDANPNPEVMSQRATAIYGETGAGQARALCEAAPVFGVSAEEARRAVSDVLKVTAAWRTAARRNGCPESEQRKFGMVFEQRAQELRDAFGL